MPKDQVFCISVNGEAVYKIMVAGRVIAAEWPDKGSAKAGLATEQRRAAKKAVAA